MAIIEYGASNPHPEGFIGLRVSVKKMGGTEFQEYFNFRHESDSKITALRAEAERINAREEEDQRLRRLSYLVNAPSKSPLSPVYGIAVGLSSRACPSGGYRHELNITVSSAGTDDSELSAAKMRCGSVARYTRSTTTYDYDWFTETWEKACRTRARCIGYEHTPSQWLMKMPTEAQVDRFILKKIAEKEKEKRSASLL